MSGRLVVMAQSHKGSRTRPETYHARWDAIIGPEAAQQRYRADVARSSAWRFGLGMVISIVVGIAVPSSAVDRIAVYCFVLLAMVTLSLQALFLYRRALQNEAASRFLQIRITSRNFPPWDAQQYERWRAKHHVPEAR
jgi:hypothetical protein